MAPTDAERRMSMACKYETSNGRCGLKGCYAYRHKCYTEDMCKCHEPPTNADRIRAMSDEELVVFFDRFSGRCLDCAEDAKNKSCPIYKEGRYCMPRDIMDWLQQPAKGE